MMVKRLVPKVGPGETAEEIVLSKFDYAELDKSSNSARVRLNSTVVNVKHAGDPNAETEAMVVYVRDFLTATIRSRCSRCGSKAVASFTDTTTPSFERLCDACVKEAMPGLGKE